MSLKQQLTDHMKQAMRDRDSLRLNTIRFALSEIKNTEIDQGELADADIEKVISKLVKSMKDAVADFKKSQRDDLAETIAEEEKKIAILAEFLPKQLSDEELKSIVADVAREHQGSQMGQVIGAVMKKVQGKADGGRVSAMVKELQQ